MKNKKTLLLIAVILPFALMSVLAGIGYFFGKAAVLICAIPILASWFYLWTRDSGRTFILAIVTAIVAPALLVPSVYFTLAYMAETNLITLNDLPKGLTSWLTSSFFVGLLSCVAGLWIGRRIGLWEAAPKEE